MDERSSFPWMLSSFPYSNMGKNKCRKMSFFFYLLLKRPSFELGSLFYATQLLISVEVYSEKVPPRSASQTVIDVPRVHVYG